MDQSTTHRPICHAAWGLRPTIAAAALVVAGILIGSAASPPSTAWGEVQPSPPPESFQSGGQLSVPILRDIAMTLHQMDARLARLETVAKQLQQRSD
jgi:hypothetical protein